MIRTLLSARRFLPLFLVQATGALNDNLFKSAMVVLLVFRHEGGAGLTALAGGLFILPYALLSASAGQVADRYDKARLIRWNKACEVILMVLGALALSHGGAAGLLAVLFGLGIQATAFGPLKYGILPQHLAPAELMAGNALIEAATFGAILLGTILGGLLVGEAAGPAIVGGLGVALSVAGLLAGRFIPPAPGAAAVPVEANIGAATLHVVRGAWAAAPVWRAVLGLSWFWALGATYLALFPVLVRDVFGAEAGPGNQIVTLLLASFAVGIGAGAMLGSRLLRGAVSFRLMLPSGLLLGVCTMLFGLVCGAPVTMYFTSVGALLGRPAGSLAVLLLIGAALAGGVFSVPLNAAIQRGAVPGERSRMVAANNVMNAVFMVAGAGVVAGLSAAGWSPGAMLVLAGAMNLLVMGALARNLPAPA